MLRHIVSPDLMYHQCTYDSNQQSLILNINLKETHDRLHEACIQVPHKLLLLLY